MLLVGDSVAMVVHGHDTTLPVTLDEMLVRRWLSSPVPLNPPKCRRTRPRCWRSSAVIA